MRERRKVMTGRVVGDKMAKTVIVEVEQRRSHPLYGKVVTRARRFKAQNDDPEAKLGDLVKITESRPYSREKRFRVSEIVQRGIVVEEIAEKELESLHAKEEADRAARRAEEERRAAERLAKLAGQEEAEEAESEEEDAELDDMDGGEEG
jgi:small subunit ribosomal protein S17